MLRSVQTTHVFGVHARVGSVFRFRDLGDVNAKERIGDPRRRGRVGEGKVDSTERKLQLAYSTYFRLLT